MNLIGELRPSILEALGMSSTYRIGNRSLYKRLHSKINHYRKIYSIYKTEQLKNKLDKLRKLNKIIRENRKKIK